MIARFAAALRHQACGAVLLETAQQAKDLTPAQSNQLTRVGNPKTTRLNLQQNLEPAELLLAHRHHRHGAPPGTPKSGGVSPQLCTGVSSLYCAYNLVAYLDGTGLRSDPKGPLFRTIGRGTGKLTRTVLPQANAHAMIRRRAAVAGIATKLGNHIFRATGITAYLKNGGTLELKRRRGSERCGATWVGAISRLACGRWRNASEVAE